MDDSCLSRASHGLRFKQEHSIHGILDTIHALQEKIQSSHHRGVPVGTVATVHSRSRFTDRICITFDIDLK